MKKAFFLVLKYSLIIIACYFAVSSAFSADTNDLEDVYVTPKTEIASLKVDEPSDALPSPCESPTYILNIRSKKFHYPDCASVNDMNEENKKEFFGSRDEAVNEGYIGCRRCDP
ncbi:MAG: hypothetical protein E7671_00215 [Ruminococcaceae bacterium]|nr:hypothetical protein [Oscillospiraceae bacterium]